jgi:hypothetical protein
MSLPTRLKDMIRPLLLFASRNASVAAALHQHFELLLPACGLPHQIEHVAFSSSVELFAAIDAIPPEQLLETMIVFDISPEDESRWEVQNIQGDQGLAAQLILSYPEIYFVFLETSLPLRAQSFDLEKQTDVICGHHYVPDGSLLTLFGLIRFHAYEFRVLFDATGLRSLIMQRLLEDSGDERAGIYRPLLESRLNHAAVCADDEIPFVYLNGYVAYTAGFRTWLLCTQKEFRRILPLKASGKIATPVRIGLFSRLSRLLERARVVFRRRSLVATDPSPFGVILSDWELTYPDYTGPAPKDSLLLSTDFNARDQLVIISSFQRADEKDTWRTFDEPPEITRLPKPYGGIFKLLFHEKGRKRNALTLRYQKTWKDIHDQKRVKKQADSRHGAPYARSIVARRLLQRARQLKAFAAKENTASWVQMALLASTAKEILGEQSRTTAYEALALQYEAEVNAEISFFGISTKLEVLRRLTTLEQEGQLIQGKNPYRKWKARQEDENSQLNFLLRTLNNLRLRFIEYEQVKATEQCVHWFAWYHRKLGTLSFTSLFPAFLKTMLVYLLWGTWGYPEFATKAGTSVWRLFCLSAFWIAIFTLGYFSLLTLHPTLSAPEKWGERIELAAWHSSFTFMSLQPGMKEVDGLTEPLTQASIQPPWLDLSKWSRTYRTLVLFELLLAYLHLGLFISILYRRITKRAP